MRAIVLEVAVAQDLQVFIRVKPCSNRARTMWSARSTINAVVHERWPHDLPGKTLGPAAEEPSRAGLDAVGGDGGGEARRLCRQGLVDRQVDAAGDRAQAGRRSRRGHSP